MKNLIKKITPEYLLRIKRRLFNQLPDKEYQNLAQKEVFEKIYSNSIWGKSEDQDDNFCSGEGSYDLGIINPYINAVNKFLSSFEYPLDVVDLGCGDFNIGSKIRSSCKNYIACDIVEPLIERNKTKYTDLHVDFRILDISEDELPEGDVVIIRQVLQHLSNELIAAVTKKIQHKYKFLILTEHLPSNPDFTPNLDKPTGHYIRLGIGKKGSGILITEPPFCLTVKESQILSEVKSNNGLIRTYLYTL